MEGLLDRPRTGRKPLLDRPPAEFDTIVEAQPDPVADGVVRWRCIDLKAVIAKRFGVKISERSVGRILNERGFRKLSARPQHPRLTRRRKRLFGKLLEPAAFPSTPRQSLSRSGFRMRPASDKRAR